MDFRLAHGREPDRGEQFAIHLARKREWHRTVAAVMYGVSYAIGASSPDGETFEAVAGSLEEAKLMKAQHEALRNQVSD